MFGYVRPRKDELKVRELDDYQAVYCGLCHTLGRRYGLFPRLFLNYDFTLLAMLLAPVSDRPQVEYRRCPACPLHRKRVCSGGTWLDIAADESVILTYWKLRDSVADSASWKKRLSARLLSTLMRRAYRKAAARRPEFDRVVTDCLCELERLERQSSPSLDHTADTFARILQTAAPPSGEEARDRVNAQILYHVGRFIYLADAWDDLEEDRRSKTYNPLLYRFPDGPEVHRDEVALTLRHSLNLAASAYNLAEFGGWSGILANILYLGLPAVAQLVLTGQFQDIKKIMSRRRHYE
ncbi:MAG: DUF5685 family protein [Intestinimonas sp.]|jgi:hypothetical protein|nr:DUF5685 family protein [Intestinimonas sp.]